jgi:hypothetical protein
MKQESYSSISKSSSESSKIIPEEQWQHRDYDVRTKTCKDLEFQARRGQGIHLSPQEAIERNRTPL